MQRLRVRRMEFKMKVKSARIAGYRLFEEETISFDETTTIIVGRNNSGKTSFVELFYKFFESGKSATFSVDDFSRRKRKSLQEAGRVWRQARCSSDSERQDSLGFLESEVVNKLPEITLEVEFSYEKNESAAPLSDLILDLDPERNDALLSCRFYIKKPREFLEEYSESRYDDILEFTRHRMSRFSREYVAIDKGDRSNCRALQFSDIGKALSCDFIYAQTLFDDTALDNGHGLSKGFEKYYSTLVDSEASFEQLEDVIQDISKRLDGEYREMFESVFTDLNTFGVNGMSALQKVAVKALFIPEALIRNSTRVVYQDETGQFLPEAHNGLGFTKLRYIVLQFISFLEAHNRKKPVPGTHLLFVEEPEAHLHPQMQSVFIRSVGEYIREKKWDAQLVITTHSSHIIAESGFKGIRYFKTRVAESLEIAGGDGDVGAALQVKDLTKFRGKLKGEKGGEGEITIRFLEQYMELRRCDMFFADTIILVEGTTERLLLPRMIEKMDALMGNTAPLSQSYVSVVEVGGAYARKFKELINFLGVPTLVITDIDSVDKEDNRKKCETSTEGAVTANSTLKSWLPRCCEVSRLLEQKVLDNDCVDGCVRVCYQVAERGQQKVGRSFEEAFILANAEWFAERAEKLISTGARFAGLDAGRVREDSYGIAGKIGSKTDFAFDILMLDEWKPPRYIEEGLKWLAEQSRNK